MRTLVFNGWAAGPEAWELTTFPRDWTFSYIEELDGLPARVMQDFDDVILVGFSMGGSMALEALLTYPEKVKGLLLISATACMLEKKDECWCGMSERRFRAFEAGTEILFANDPSPIYAPENMRRGLEYLVATDNRAALRELAKARGFDFPVEIVYSEKDGIVRPTNAAFFEEIFPMARVTCVPGNEHTLPITCPEIIDGAYASILKRLK